ncbi:MAG: S-layer homology domain-containing protein [Bacillota bacterium]|nr:S-layer homology domain-containing protein [Bacillota bacterium]
MRYSYKYFYIKLIILIIFTGSVIIFCNNSSFAAFNVNAVQAVSNPDSQINLSWDLVPNCLFYKIFRNSGSGDVLIKTIDVNSDKYYTSYSDTGANGAGLIPETQYSYTIRAYSDQAMTVEIVSAAATVTTAQMIKPTNLSAVFDINTNNVALTWKNNSFVLTGSSIKVVGGTGSIASATGNANTCSFSDPGIVKGQQVQYVVVSTDSNGHMSLDSDPVSVLPIDPPVITAVVNNGIATVSWGSYANISNFELQRSRYTDSWGAWQTINSQLGQTGSSVNDALPTTGLYRYRVVAKTSGAYTGYSNVSESVAKPAAPTKLTCAFESQNCINLNWTIDLENESVLNVERKAGNGSYSVIASLPKTTDSYSDTFSVVPGTVYSYRVTAYDSATNKISGTEYSIAAAIPAAPTNLTLSNTSDTLKSLSWTDAAANESGFRIERKTDSGSFVEIGTTAVNITTYDDKTTVSGHSYTYRVWAYNYFGNSSSPSNEVTITPDNIKAPNSLEAAVMSSSLVKLTWTYPANISTVTVIERKTQGGAWSKLSEVAASTLCYYDYSVSANVHYFYRIKAKYGANIYSSTFPADDTGKEAFSVFSILTLNVVNSSKIDLKWDDSATGKEGYIVSRKVDSGEYSQLATVASDKVTYSDYTVTTGHTYTYRILVINSSTSTTIYSNEVSTTTNTVVNPDSLEVDVVSPTQMELTWSLSALGNFRTVIERKMTELGEWEEIGYVDGTTIYEDNDLADNTKYFYRVKIYYSANIYSQSYPNDDTGIGAFTRIITPYNLSGSSPSASQIDLVWTPSSYDAYFIIERKTSKGEFTQVGKTDVNAAKWTDTSLIPNSKYTYRIKAKNQYNESDYSQEINVTCVNLAAPSGLTASVSDSSGIDLSWVDNSPNESGFEIWRLTAGSQTWELLMTLDSNARSYKDSDITPQIQYSYKIRAYISKDDVYSAYSNTVVSTLNAPLAPSELTYSSIDDTTVKLIWKDNSNNESGFKVEKKDNISGKWLEIASLSQDVTSFNVSNLDSSTNYIYRIKAYNQTYNSYSCSNELLVSLINPEDPSRLSLTALSSTEIKVTWKDNSDNEMGFSIERNGDDGEFAEIAKVAQNTTTFTDKGLKPGQEYFYRVRAYNGNGYSFFTDIKSTKTKDSPIYNDINTVNWAKNAIESLTGRGIIKGKADGMFYPNDKITRAEFVVLIFRAFKPDTAVVAGSFKDVNARDWFYKEVMSAKNLGIISGNNLNYFYPNKPITREDAAVIITRTLITLNKPLNGSATDILKDFSDVSKVSGYALSSMAALYGEKIINGKAGGVLAPKAYTTRAEAAVLISNIVGR